MKISTEFSMSGLLIGITIVFIILKLADVITWNWWLVCSPLLFVAGMLGVVLLAVIVFAVVCKVVG